jgi:hypothetical protein
MLKATATGPDGRSILVIGLSFGNLKKFLNEPGKTMIRVDGKEMDLPVDVLMFSGETEADMQETMAEAIGPQTIMHDYRPGPTGDYPRGKIDDTDEGGLQIAVGAYKDVVRVDFGKPTAWVGLPPEQAFELARLLTKHAAEIRG